MSKQSEKVKRWRKNTKKRIIKAMGGSCVCCGYSRCQSALALHHINPKEKDFGFGRIRANPKSWEKLVKELRKCVLVCHNCHSEIHYGIKIIPNNAAKFNEKYVNYSFLKEIGEPSEPDKYHACPQCKAQIPDFTKYCSRKCSAAGALKFDWKNFNLEKMYKEMSVVKMAKIIGCSDVAIHKRLKKLGLK